MVNTFPTRKKYSSYRQGVEKSIPALKCTFYRTWRTGFHTWFLCSRNRFPPRVVRPKIPVPEFIDPFFGKTSPKRSFSVTENERFGLVFAKTGSINSGTAQEFSISVQSKKFLPGERQRDWRELDIQIGRPRTYITKDSMQ